MPDWQRAGGDGGVTAQTREHLPGRVVAASIRMLLFRSITVGLLGACLYMLANVSERVDQSVMAPIVVQHVVEAPPAPPPPAISIVDVGRGVPVATILSLLDIAPGERIASVDDHRVDNDPFAGMLLAEAVREGPRFVDLTIAARNDVTRTRRLLVLLH